ncbi:MAG: M24 family metallopeptidase, partial [Gaiellaceae bacterium]
VAGLGAIMPAADEATLRQSLAGVELVDANAAVLAAKECKDEAELDGTRAATRLARSAYDAAPDLLRVGASAQHAVAQLEQILRSEGALELLVFVDRGPYVVRRVSETVFRPGDLVSVLVEVANADGYWVEIGGLFSLGEPSDKSADLAAGCYEALERIADTCRVGTPVREAAECLDEIAQKRALGTGVGLAHGVGIDHDLPNVTHGSTESFKSGHVVSIHPNLLDEEAALGAVVADGFIVGTDGEAPERISGLDSKLTVLAL